MDLCLPQTTSPGYIDLQALPDPNLAKKEAFLKKKSFFKEESSFFSISMIHKAKALMEEAEEAIPLLCGKVFSVSITKLKYRI